MSLLSFPPLWRFSPFVASCVTVKSEVQTGDTFGENAGWSRDVVIGSEIPFNRRTEIRVSFQARPPFYVDQNDTIIEPIR